MHPKTPQNQPDVFQGDQKSFPLPYEDNAISSPPISNLESKIQQPLHQSQTDNLFTTIAFSIYVMIIGCFFGAFILFFVLLVIKPTYAFSYLTLYSGLGIVVYGLGFIAWKVKIRSKLVNKQNHYQPAIFQQQVKSYLITFFVVNFLAYILLAWFLMILLGTFNGFGINFIDRGPNDVIIAFGEKGFLNQIRIYGLILFYTTLFVSLTIFLLYRWYKKWKTKANKILSNRRQTIAQAYNQSSSHLSPPPSSSTTPTNPVNQTNLTNPSKPSLQQLPLKDNDQKSSQLGNERITNNFGHEQKMVVSGDDQQLPTNPPSPPYITKTVGYESEFSQKMSWRNRQMRCQMQKKLVSNYVAHLK